MTKHSQSVYIVDGARTPFLKARNKSGPFSASDLAVFAGRELLARQTFSPEELDEVIIGCAIPAPEEANIGRVVSMRLGCGKDVTAWTVQRNCASGMQALDSAIKDILIGRHDLVLAGGCDAMSHAPLLYNKVMVNWFAQMMASKSVWQKLRLFGRLRPKMFAPVIALIAGLKDHTVGFDMGQTAEQVAYHFGIDRQQMDEFAVESHLRLAKAQQENHFNDEIIPVFDAKGNAYEFDDGVRHDSSVAKLAKLKPFFDKKFGAVTAGNSSQITDGAALLLLASEEAVKKHKLNVIGRIVDTQWAGVDPREMGLGPVHAVPPLLQRHDLNMDDIAAWEINEAFAGQVLGCIKAWQDTDYCKTNLGLDAAFGKLDQAKLNVDGGAIALGHPIGATGARIVLHTLNVLRREQAQYGVATLCIGGGQGGAMLIENVSSAKAGK